MRSELVVDLNSWGRGHDSPEISEVDGHPLAWTDLTIAAEEYKALHAAVGRIESIPNPMSPASPTPSASNRFS